MEKQVKEQIVELSRVLKLKKMFGKFIIYFEPFKKIGNKIKTSQLLVRKKGTRCFTKKISVVLPETESDLFTKLKIIDELVIGKSSYVSFKSHNYINSIDSPFYHRDIDKLYQRDIDKQNIIDLYLENYFQENKDKYKVKKTDVFFLTVFGLIYTIIFLSLFIFGISIIFNYGLILIMLLFLWFCIVLSQYKLCFKNIF